MPRRVPIKAAKDVAKGYDLKQVILLGWDGNTTHVVTFGKSLVDKAQAAKGGNVMKKFMDWPEKLCKVEPVKIQNMKDRIKQQAKEIESLKAQLEQRSSRRCS